MKNQALESILQDYRSQRRYRESKRNEYLRKFEHLKLNKADVGELIEKKVASEARRYDSETEGVGEEELTLRTENQKLKNELLDFQASERDSLMRFQQEIKVVKDKYLSEIKSITEAAKAGSNAVEEKLKKLKDQTQLAVKKNLEIEEVNRQIEKDLSESKQTLTSYTQEINKEYTEKINEFEQMFESSNEKIEAMEKEFNEDEFVENALKNEELMKSIEENASKNEQTGKVLEDYKELLSGKAEILVQINNNNEMKEKEISKFIELEGKIKVIIEKINSEKKIYLSENSQMAQELMEVKNLLMGVMNEGQ